MENIEQLTLGEIRALKGKLEKMIENAVLGEVIAFGREHGLEVNSLSVFGDRVDIRTAGGEEIGRRLDVSATVRFRGEGL